MGMSIGWMELVAILTGEGDAVEIGVDVLG